MGRRSCLTRSTQPCREDTSLAVDELTIPLGAPPFSRRTAGFFGWFAALWALMNVALTAWAFSAMSSPGRAFTLGVLSFLVWSPFFGAYLLIRAGSRIQPRIEFNDHRVTLSGFLTSSTVEWANVGRLYMTRRIGSVRSGGALPALVLERSGQGVVTLWGDAPIAIQPDAVSPGSLHAVVEEMMRRVPASAIDPDVALLFGLDGLADESGSLRSAVLEYFAGRFSTALAVANSAVAAGAARWELLLCAALCQRALGDQGEYFSLLAATTSATPPSDVGRVLAACVEQRHRADGVS
jgi:hypothetical protein